MNATELKTLFDYHYWANRQVWDCVLKLNDEQFTQDLDYSIGSIQRHLAHMMVVEWFWFVVATDRLPADRSQHLKSSAFTRQQSIRERWDALETELNEYLNSASDEQLNCLIDYEFSWCGKQQHPTWTLLMYIITHAVDHRAQILQGIHRLQGETVAQDFVRYLWEQP